MVALPRAVCAAPRQEHSTAESPICQGLPDNLDKSDYRLFTMLCRGAALWNYQITLPVLVADLVIQFQKGAVNAPDQAQAATGRPVELYPHARGRS